MLEEIGDVFILEIFPSLSVSAPIGAGVVFDGSSAIQAVPSASDRVDVLGAMEELCRNLLIEEEDGNAYLELVRGLRRKICMLTTREYVLVGIFVYDSPEFGRQRKKVEERLLFPILVRGLKRYDNQILTRASVAVMNPSGVSTPSCRPRDMLAWSLCTLKQSVLSGSSEGSH